MLGGIDATTYVGADRRQARPLMRRPVPPGRLVAFAIAVAVVGLIVPMALTAHGSPTTVHDVQIALRALWPTLFVSAGILRLTSWRLTGESRGGLTGAALVSFGILYAPTTALSPLLRSTERDLWLAPATRSIAVVIFLVLLVWAMWAPPVSARLRPLRVLTGALGLAAVALAVLIAAAQSGHRIALPDAEWFVLGLVFAAAFLALGTAVVRRAVQARNSSGTWLGLGLFLLGIAEAIHATAFVKPATIVLYASCLRLVVGVLAVVNSAADLGVVLSADGNSVMRLRGALLDTEQQLTAEEAEQEERLHDARSVIAALKAASLTLDRYDERLDHAMKHRLRATMVTELSRLERVIAGRQEDPLEVFRLDAALTPVLTAEREAGLVICKELGSLAAKGRPLELATVVQNLLVNARNYAPGSVVRVTARCVGSDVQVLVEDRGPGIDPREHARIFERGYRTAAAAGREGTGLGLYLARRLMREQGGDIEVRERPGGGVTFVIRVLGPTAAEVQLELPVQRESSSTPSRGVLVPASAELPAT